MIDTKMRKFVQIVFAAAAKPVIAAGISANAVTVTAFIIGLITAFCIAFGFWTAALYTLWLSGFLDALDGTVARNTHTTTKAGAFLDLLFDRIVEGFIVIAFAYAQSSLVFPALFFLFSALFNFSTFLLAGALFKNNGKKSMHYDAGIIERTEVFVFFSIMLIIPALSAVTLWVMDLLIFITGIIRFRKIYTFARKRDVQGDTQ